MRFHRSSMANGLIVAARWMEKYSFPFRLNEPTEGNKRLNGKLNALKECSITVKMMVLRIKVIPFKSPKQKLIEISGRQCRPALFPVILSRRWLINGFANICQLKWNMLENQFNSISRRNNVTVTIFFCNCSSKAKNEESLSWSQNGRMVEFNTSITSTWRPRSINATSSFPRTWTTFLCR